jgi:hypothetical protein
MVTWRSALPKEISSRYSLEGVVAFARASRDAALFVAFWRSENEMRSGGRSAFLE